MNFLFVWISLIWGPDVLFCGLSWNLSFFQAKWPFSLISRACGWIYKAADRREQHSWSRLHLIFESTIHLQCAIMVIRPCAESRRLSRAKCSSFSSSDYTVHRVCASAASTQESVNTKNISFPVSHRAQNTQDGPESDWLKESEESRKVRFHLNELRGRGPLKFPSNFNSSFFGGCEAKLVCQNILKTWLFGKADFLH